MFLQLFRPMVNSRKQAISNFSRSKKTSADVFRPDSEEQLVVIAEQNTTQGILARGNGLSYSDCCLNDKKTIIDTTRLNHFIEFDNATGIVICQASVTFADLFLVDKAYVPPVIPGTLYATVAGGIANDVHGKNNPQAGSFGHHVVWLDLQIGSQTYRCSREENASLFAATVAGVGLTGIITRAAIRLRQASRTVSKTTHAFTNIHKLLAHMQNQGLAYDYQAAWLDLLNQPHALLTLANHCAQSDPELQSQPLKAQYTLPTLPVCLVRPRVMKQFNRWYFQQAKLGEQLLPLWKYNNPLDAIPSWNNLYGPHGLLQFQAVFPAEEALHIIHNLLNLIKKHRAHPLLAVLKYFTQSGLGLLSFTQPGFTLAIDFANNQAASLAIAAMNQLIAKVGGKVYLAKDMLLTREQFISMYPKQEAFTRILSTYPSAMYSDLGKRLGVV